MPQPSDNISVTPIRPVRPVQKGIPATRSDRADLLSAIRRHVETYAPVPPLSAEELREHTGQVLADAGLDEAWQNYAAVLFNNEVWQETLAGIPYNRRLLLLPQCLRAAEQCPAQVDELGLACRQCGRCCLGEITGEAERLGYVVLIAEGSPVVMSLIESGQVQAVIGVSCLSVLEKVFPYMEAAAIPGVAIPLLQDGCADTSADMDWIWEALYLTSDDKTRRLDLEALRREVEACFSDEAMDALLGRPDTRTEGIARDWMTRSGKRWRPFLAACAFKALQKDPGGALPADFRPIALAVECFHKASLIHDDIEDQDELRYGRKTLHEQYGIPVALNTGDYLLGVGYSLIAESPAPAELRAPMLRAAAAGHRELCVGQGEELCWARSPGAIPTAKVVDIFRRKTSPAFEVALHLGAIRAGADEEVLATLSEYSEALGVAYQIRDDLADFSGDGGDGWKARPSVLLSLAFERGDARQREVIEAVWRRTDAPGEAVEQVLADLQIEALAGQMLEACKGRAIRCLTTLRNANLKGLLRRVVGRIFRDVETMSCCNDYRAGNAPGSEPRPEPSE